MMQGRMWGLVVATAVLLAGCADGSSDPVSSDEVAGGEAACEAPRIEVAATEVAPGDSIDVLVSAAYADCYDQGEGDSPAVDSITLVLSAGQQRLALGTFDVADDGSARIAVVVPDVAPPGEATVTSPTLPHADSTPFTITD